MATSTSSPTGAPEPITPKWTVEQWVPLLNAIRWKECTPFLGAGACAGRLPLGGAIAKEWGSECKYPFGDEDNLPRVAKYMSVFRRDRMLPANLLVEMFDRECHEGYMNPPFCHKAVAEMDLPMYMTSNYDDFMFEALRTTPLKRSANNTLRQPQRMLCRWNGFLQRFEPDPFASGYQPSIERPLVFHMHGHISNKQSLVLTEDDYLEFLVNVSKDNRLLPEAVERAMAASTLLFLGYRLEDLNFKVILRRLASYLTSGTAKNHVAVQLPPSRDGTDAEEWQKIVSSYFEQNYQMDGVTVYWGTCDEFLAELKWAESQCRA